MLTVVESCRTDRLPVPVRDGFGGPSSHLLGKCLNHDGSKDCANATDDAEEQPSVPLHVVFDVTDVITNKRNASHERGMIRRVVSKSFAENPREVFKVLFFGMRVAHPSATRSWA
jgi:hypothetical protein